MKDKNIWKVNCMDDEWPGLWRHWYKNQCVTIGFSPYYKPHHLRNNKGWAQCKNIFKKIKIGDYIIAALHNNKMGRIGTIIELAVDDKDWNPIVPKSKDRKDGNMGRRILVRWDLLNGPEDPDIVIKMPKSKQFNNGELRPTMSQIRSLSINEIIDIAKDESNWVGTSDKFSYEKALSDYIANNPHRLEDGLMPYPDAKVREKVFDDKSRLDILLMDNDNNPVVVECKQNPATKIDIEQLLHYMGKIKKETCKKPRGILIHGGAPSLKDISETKVNKYMKTHNIQIRNYRLDVEFRNSFGHK